MLGVRWQPFNEVWQDLNRIHNGLTQSVGASRRLGAAFPAINMWQDEQTLYAEAELPGFDISDIDVSIDQGERLTISGERNPPEMETGQWIRRERGHGKFSRSVMLPFPVDSDEVKASFKHGVLLIELPKQEEMKPRRIEVQAG